MPLFLWIGTLLGTLLTTLVQFFMNFFTKRLLIIGFVVVSISAFTFGFFAAIVALVNGLSFALPSEVTAGLSLVIPSNFPLCVSAIVAAHVIRWIYEWNVKVIQFRLS